MSRASSTRRAGILALPALAATTVTLGGVAAGAAPTPELISRAPGGGPPGNAPSAFPTVSADGRFVAFRSQATNLHPDDVDTQHDIFVRDRQTGEVGLVSRASGPNGAKGRVASFNPRISADGRFVAFRSNSNLAPEDTDRIADIYVRDLQTQQTILVSRASGESGEKGNGGSFNPSISADGRRVAFRSEATNLHPDDGDAIFDIYVRDLQTTETILVSRAAGGAGAKGIGVSQFPVISGDGNRIAFRSGAPNLHPDDADTIEDIFVRDLGSGETILVSRATGEGPKGNARSTFASISADGRRVAFDSLATNLHPEDPDDRADVFLHDLDANQLELVSRADGAAGAKGSSGSAEPSISADGRHVAFHSVATNLDPGDLDPVLDVYIRDLETFDTTLLSGAVTGEADGRSYEPAISAQGKLVAFHSEADNLSGEDLGASLDVFAVGVAKPPKCFGKRATAMAAADALTRGTRGRDVIVGSDGDEEVKTGKGRDLVCAGVGDDVIVTGGGKDTLDAGGGADVVRSGRGRDQVKAGGGADVVGLSRGRDTVKGGGGADRIKGARAADTLRGNGGRDLLDGGAGTDTCRGGGGKDRLKRCERGSD
jgi:Tol biopolymer transport system component